MPSQNSMMIVDKVAAIMNRETVSQEWVVKCKDLDLNIELSATLIGGSLSQAQTIVTRGERLVICIKNPVRSDLKDEVNDYIKVIESYQNYVLSEIKKKK